MTESRPAFGSSAPSARSREAGVVSSPKGFWHQPLLMNLVSTVLTLAASIVFGVAVFKLMVQLPVFALREVVIISPLGHVTHEQLRSVARAALRGNFFTIDLDGARQSFEKLPWVREAQLRRRWPGTIEVVLEEHQAVAYWRSLDSGDTRLVNTFGELFDAAANAPMPVFSGPPEASTEMLAQMRRFETILEPVERHVATLTLSGRHAWQLRLDNGVLVELGKDQVGANRAEGEQSLPEARLARFVALWPQTEKQLGKTLTLADLRYTTGFAVRTAEGETGKQGNKGKL